MDRTEWTTLSQSLSLQVDATVPAKAEANPKRRFRPHVDFAGMMPLQID